MPQLRMTEEQVSEEAKTLARVVVLSLKDQVAVSSWLKENGDYHPQGDRVVSEALVIIRKTLRADSFDLATYKVKNKRKKK
jgi:hypothetical protein